MYLFNAFSEDVEKVLRQLRCPVLTYDSVLEKIPDGTPFCTTAKKFEQDIISLQENGYTAISVPELSQRRNALPEKPYSIAFVGGYLNTYEIAFPILRKYKIPAAVFLETTLIRKTDEGEINAGMQYLSWGQAREMLASGLISFYPVWRPTEQSNTLSDELRNQIQTIDTELPGSNSGCAVYCGNAADWVYKMLTEMESKLIVMQCSKLNLSYIQSGAVGSITVSKQQEVLDTLEDYKHCCESIVTKETEAAKTPSYPEPRTEVTAKSVRLPIDPQPRVRNYLRHAFPLSILQTKRMDRVDRFLLRSYIDVIYKPAYDWLDFHNVYYENCGEFTCRKITRDLLEINGIHVVEYLINGLSLGYYGDIWLDTYYIPNKPGCGKVHMTHGLLVYGYDSQTHEFEAMSYDNSDHYHAIRIPAKNIFLACTNRYFQYLNLIKIDDQYIEEYDLAYICGSLRDYLDSVCYDDNNRFSKKCEEQYYQYSACLKFQELLIRKAKEKGSIHTTSMYSFSEQKRIMLWRIQYIARREGLTLPETDALALSFSHCARFVLNGSLKYNMKPNEELLKQIYKSVEELNKSEKQMIEELLRVLYL